MSSLVARMTPTAYNFIAAIVPPLVIPPEERYRCWATSIDHRVNASAYVVLGEDIEAATTLHEVTGKDVFMRVIVSPKTEDELTQISEKAASITGIVLAWGDNSDTELTMGKCIEIFAKNQIVASSVQLPSARLSAKDAMRTLAEQINLGLTVGVLSPWTWPEITTQFLQEFQKSEGADLTPWQAVCPLAYKEQWTNLRIQGLNVSPIVGKHLDNIPKRLFHEQSLEVEAKTLEDFLTLAPNRIKAFGSCIDFSQVPEDGIEDIMERFSNTLKLS